MVRPQRLLQDRQRPLIQGLGLGVPALGAVKHRQVVEARGDIGVLWPECLFSNRQRPLVKRLGLGVAALGVVEPRAVVKGTSKNSSFSGVVDLESG